MILNSDQQLFPLDWILEHVRLYLLTSLKIEFDTDQKWQVWHPRILIHPFLVQIDLHMLAMLLLRDGRSSIAWLYMLSVKWPYVFCPAELFVSLFITSHACVFCVEISSRSFFEVLTLRNQLILDVSIKWKVRAVWIRWNFPFQESHDGLLFRFITDLLLFLIIDLLTLLLRLIMIWILRAASCLRLGNFSRYWLIWLCLLFSIPHTFDYRRSWRID